MIKKEIHKPRMHDIDSAKGLAIVLVVFGHLFSNSHYTDNIQNWYMHVHSAIYHFHMPFFMYLSGFVTFFSGHNTMDHRYGRYIKAQSIKLLLPFLLIGVFIVVGKYVVNYYFYIDRVPDTLGEGLLSLVWNTGDSPARFIWYVFVLFVFRAATPLLDTLLKGRVSLILALSLVLFWVTLPPVLFLPRMGTHYFFFILGGVAAIHWERIGRLFDRYCFLFMALFAAICICESLPFSFKEWAFVAGLASVPALHCLMRFPVFSHSRVLNALGNSTYTIYLFNTIFIGLTKLVLSQFLPLEGGGAFAVYTIVLLAAGVCGPLFLRQFVFQRVRILRLFS
ncbi:acyltransferase family protein [Pseudodesulfovibrio sediminis]|uniref:acyltransferase family protein n=1 Tax=Pseudodesulfovibrio sediminis TaxID=2810563 RepID=UPI001E4A6FCD|nr:acyltransferase [Pseudodesulfovibrio sediminis]